ncbi:hypothetical protein GQ53DRAFT_525856 [Thozetella sp. PMI_491]|nr:hypothetical protein GQ53DRAFT_525856 [Thozetella sp. PMI_491]
MGLDAGTRESWPARACGQPSRVPKARRGLRFANGFDVWLAPPRPGGPPQAERPGARPSRIPYLGGSLRRWLGGSCGGRRQRAEAALTKGQRKKEEKGGGGGRVPSRSLLLHLMQRVLVQEGSTRGRHRSS